MKKIKFGKYLKKFFDFTFIFIFYFILICSFGIISSGTLLADTILFLDGFEAGQDIYGTSRKLWYICYLRNGHHSQSNVVIGGLYFMEAYIVHPSGYRERANIETPPRFGVPDTQFILRMDYRGRDGQRHRQPLDICPVVNRERWYKVKMLVDLSGSNPYYAWWLNDSLIWFEYDTSSGDDTLPPTEFHVDACWIDW